MRLIQNEAEGATGLWLRVAVAGLEQLVQEWNAQSADLRHLRLAGGDPCDAATLAQAANCSLGIAADALVEFDRKGEITG